MRRKLTSLALLILVTTMIVGSLPNHAFADSQSDSLIRIATQARDQISIQLSKISYVSDELRAQFEEGSAKIELLKEAAKQDDISSARQHFLSAMKIFNEISQKISVQPTTEAALSDSRPLPNLTNELDRLERYIDRLKDIAAKNSVNIDFGSIEDLIDSARKKIDDNNDAAYSAIDEIKRSIIKIKNIIKEKTRQSTTERAKSFAEMHLQQLDRLIAEAQEIGVSQNSIKQLIEARDNLYTASDVDQIVREVKHLISVKKQFEDTKAERIKSRINQLEVKLERLSNYADPAIEKAKSMLGELNDLVSEDKLDEAVRMLISVNSLITEIENSIDSESELSTDGEDESIRNLDDSKVDRIKLKIQRLENEMNQLAEKVESPAAKRWLDNAFSLLENAKSQIDESADETLNIIMKIEQILKRIQNTL